MRRKPQNHSVFYYLVNSFILFLLLTSIGCSNQLNLEKHTDLVFKESYYQSWVSGVKGGGSGLIIFLTLGDSSSKNIQLEGIYFKDPYKLYLKLKNKIRSIERGGCQEQIETCLLNTKMPYMNDDGKFTGGFDKQKYNELDKYGKMKADSFYKRVMKFVQSEDLNDLFPNCI